MKLVIAEKPSVAQSLAAVLGAKERGQGYLQGNGYVVSWCVGHLIGLAAADAYDARYSKWCYEDLPIIPEEWKYTVAPDKKDQYEVLVSLMNRPDVESLVCATDAGREGELIFRLVYDHAGCTKPFERLWIADKEYSHLHIFGEMEQTACKEQHRRHKDACKQMLLFSCHKLSSPFMKTPATRDGSRWMAFITP